MRLADLLWAEAVTEDGETLGQVHDVRLCLDDDAGGDRSLTVDGVIVGTGAVWARLGYAYGDVRGPWLVAALLRRIGRSARYVSWDRVAGFDGHVVRVSGRADDLPHPADARDDSR